MKNLSKITRSAAPALQRTVPFACCNLDNTNPLGKVIAPFDVLFFSDVRLNCGIEGPSFPAFPDLGSWFC